MYSCNWMFNVAEAGTYVIDTKTASTFTIVSALVKYYDTTAAEDGRCSVRLCPNTTVSAIISETLYNKDVVEVSNMPFTVSGGGRLFLHTTGPVSLMLSVVSENVRPAPGPLPVPFDIGNCTIDNPPWWVEYAKVPDNYSQFTSRSYYFTSTRTAVDAGITNSVGGPSETGANKWNNRDVNSLVYQGSKVDLWSYDPYPTYFRWAESYGRVYAHLNTLRRVEVLWPYVFRWELSVEIRLFTGDAGFTTWENGVAVLSETMLSEQVGRSVSPTDLVFKDSAGYEYRIH